MKSVQSSEVTGLMARADSLYRSGDLAAAAQAYGAVLARWPDHVESWFNLATLLQSLGQVESALRGYDQVIALRPDHVDAILNRGVALKNLGQPEAALASYDRAIGLRPDYALAYNNRGNLLKQLGRLEEARRDYDQAIALQPGYASAHSNRGALSADQGDFAAALVDYECAVGSEAAQAETWFNRGNALWEVQREEEALASYARAIALRPGYLDAVLNRGVVFKETRRFAEALACFETVLALRPDFAEARFNKAMCRLQCGALTEAWPDYEARWETSLLRNAVRPFPQPLWKGEGLAGRVILLHAEQGLGDTLNFCRYVPLVAARGGRVVLEVQPALRSLLSGLPGIEQLVARGDSLPPFACHCPLLSLPRLFETTLATIPPIPAGITPSASLVAAWQARLGPATRPRIGLVWNGSATHRNDRHRSLSLAALAPWRTVGAELISLQKELRPADQAMLATWPELRHFGPDLTDLADTAALCSLMDLVISVDTSVAHLAATLGRPTWILLPHRNTDWRWLLDRTDSPWYPSATLYRQRPHDGWPPLLEQITEDLRAFTRSRL